MSSREEPTLFDLPLDPDPPLRRKRSGGAGGSKESAVEADREVEQAALPFEDDEELEAESEPADEEAWRDDEGEYEDGEDEGLAGERLFAGLADLAVHGAVSIVALTGMGILGIVPSWQHLPALLLFLVPFSFVYCVVPLAFWGQTPGMAWRELRAVGPDEEPLTVGQAILRWLAALATLLFVGLPAFLLLTGRSLGDRWGRSSTNIADL